MEHSVFALGDEEPQVTLDEWVDPAEEVLRDIELQAIGSTTPDVPQVHGQAQSSGPEAGLGAPVTNAPDILPTMDTYTVCVRRRMTRKQPPPLAVMPPTLQSALATVLSEALVAEEVDDESGMLPTNSKRKHVDLTSTSENKPITIV